METPRGHISPGTGGERVGRSPVNMNVDRILAALNAENTRYLLIGGMNFLIRHLPELTFDVDLWVEDTPENLAQVNRALLNLGAAWGPTEETWAPVPQDWRWLTRQSVFCLTTEHGAVDIFREVHGLEGKYQECRERAVGTSTSAGCAFLGLSDRDMLACQEALPESERKPRRIARLREAIQQEGEG